MVGSLTPIDTVYNTIWRSDLETLCSHLNGMDCSPQCGTHIRVSLSPKYDLEKVKRIAQAVLHFEPAFEDLVPAYRRNHRYAKSNLSQLCRAGRGSNIQAKTTEREIVQLMHSPRPDPPPQDANPSHYSTTLDSNFAWDFTGLSRNVIEFRNATPCTSAEEILSWTELTFSFIHAAHRTPASELEAYSTGIGGLWAFIERFFVPGLNEPARMTALWANARNRPDSAYNARRGRR